MNEWKPDRSGQFLTVVYKNVVPGDEVGALHEHPKVCAMSWSNALHDVDYLRNRLPAQKPWVGLMRGVRVEGDTVVISVHYGNDAARQLCADLIKEMNI